MSQGQFNPFDQTTWPAGYWQMMATAANAMNPYTYGMNPVTSAMLAGSLGNYYGGQAQVGAGLAEMLGLNEFNSQAQQNLNQQELQREQIQGSLANQKQQIANNLALGNTALGNQLAMQKNSLGALGNIFGGMFGNGGLSGLFSGLGNTLGGLFGGANPAGGGSGGGENAFSGFAAPLLTGFQSPSGQSASLNLGGQPPQTAASFSNSGPVNPSGSPFTGGAGAPSAAMAQRQNRMAVPPGQRPLYDSLLAGGGQPAYA